MTHAEAVGNTRRRAAAALIVVLTPGIVGNACRRNFDGLANSTKLNELCVVSEKLI